VAASKLPPSVDWEVVVVDNNSSDSTRHVVELFCREFPGRFRYVFEPKQGKSNALNRGIREAQGDILAFTDDDITVEPTWLHNLTADLTTGEWDGAAGRIILQWPASVPKWLAQSGKYARHGLPGFDQGNAAKELIGPPFGANMAFRKAVFLKHGGFRPDLGPRPGSEIRSEDTEFGRRLLAAGGRLRYVPSAVVYHPVPENRMNRDFLLAWWFDKGRADAREFEIPKLRNMASAVLWAGRWSITLDPAARFYQKLVVWQKAGTIFESCWQVLRTPKTW
jgi:cellulose synthase/poly-beta-1,6-N-acetylglucosamine synthase-like glycosyltransferase